jgi:RNA polymerase sigma-70 factor (ECF subfamily)
VKTGDERPAPMLVVATHEADLCDVADEVLAGRADTDLEAFSELYDRYLCRIYRFVRSQTADEATAEDLTAHTFFRALSSASSFKARGSYRSWLFRIAHNTVATWRAHRSKAPVVVEEVPERSDPDPSPASIVVSGEERSVLWKLVSALAPAQREVLALRYLEDLTTAEIADVTGRSHGAIRILLHRARNSLRKALEEKGIS